MTNTLKKVKRVIKEVNKEYLLTKINSVRKYSWKTLLLLKIIKHEFFTKFIKADNYEARDIS